MKNYLLKLVVAALLFAVSAESGEVFTLKQFLIQVEKGHTGLKGAAQGAEGAEERAREADATFWPSLFATAQLSNDRSPKLTPSFQGTKTLYNTYSLGISEVTPVGLAAKLYYNLNYTQIEGANAAFLPQSSFYDARPVLELSLPLFRNLIGAETRATAVASEAAALSATHAQRYQVRLTASQAELVYWRLALSRSVRSVQKASLERALKIREWSAGRAKSGLADNSDLLQAEAALKIKNLDYQAALDEERLASLAFNLARGIDSAEVNEVVTDFAALEARSLRSPKFEKRREDVEAAYENQRAVQASARAGIERNKPTLELYSTLTLNGRNAEQSTAMSDSFKLTQPNNVVGLRLNVPLSVSIQTHARSGYQKEIQAAELSYDRKVLEQVSEWTDLSKRLDEARRRFELAQEIEDAQKEKVLYERQRLSRGKTTTYFVLLFEQDYAVAQIARLRAQSDIVNVIAQMKTFGG